MKRKIPILIGASVLIFALSQSITSQPTGTPIAATGGIAENYLTCTQSGCHSGIPGNVTNYFTTNIPSTGYVPKRTYNISVAFNGSGKKGFQISAQDSIGGHPGTLKSATGCKIQPINYITHTSAKTADTAKWNFTWIAPARGTGKFSFYGAFAITTSTTRKQSIAIKENKSVPVITTLPATEVFHTHVMAHLNMNAKTGVYSVAFRYKAEGGAWTFLNASATEISGDSIVPVKIMLYPLLPTTKYIVQACALNPGDTIWADTMSFTTTLTGMAEQKSLNNLTVYPQPAHDKLNINFFLNTASEVKIDMYALSGERVSTTDYNNTVAGKNEIEIPVEFPKGIYLLHLETAGEKHVQKILIN